MDNTRDWRANGYEHARADGFRVRILVRDTQAGWVPTEVAVGTIVYYCLLCAVWRAGH